MYNRFLFKLNDVHYGKNFKVFNKIYLIGKGTIKIGNDFMFTSGDCINPISRNLRGCIYTEPHSKITIGDRVGISSSSFWISKELTIGNDVKIGADTLVIDTDSHQIDYRLRKMIPHNSEEIKYLKSRIQSKTITIEDDVWIGAKCIILKGVTIGARSIIGAGSVVTKNIPSDCIAAGNPCRVIKHLSKE
jgi:acetyltransferase-like isoleucine patch superfamily enzyme